MIGKQEGEAILGYKKDFPHKKVQVVYKFETNHPDDHVEVELWMSSSDDQSAEFVQQFMEYIPLIHRDVSVTPRFYHWSCTNCSEVIKEYDCVSDGMYCGMNSDFSTPGVNIVQENLRQKCLHVRSKFA